jgi:hypothetical protein
MSGRIILKRIFKELKCEDADWIYWAGTWGPLVGCSEYGNDPSGSIN